MKKKILALLLFLFLPTAAFAQSTIVSSTDLINNASALDGQTIVYTGEVIGDIMQRGDHTWLNLSDGNNAIGIWVATDQMGTITVAGRYGQVGDTVQVTGVFHRACRDHGGDMDIHAVQLQRITQGHTVAHPVSAVRVIFAVATAGVGIGIVICLRQKQRKL